jgi:hypothetical protein
VLELFFKGHFLLVAVLIIYRYLVVLTNIISSGSLKGPIICILYSSPTVQK